MCSSLDHKLLSGLAKLRLPRGPQVPLDSYAHSAYNGQRSLQTTLAELPIMPSRPYLEYPDWKVLKIEWDKDVF